MERRPPNSDGYDAVNLNSPEFNGSPNAQSTSPVYPPQPQKQVHMQDGIPFDAASAKEYSGMPMPKTEQSGNPQRPAGMNSRNPSWDLLSGIKSMENGYTEFDSRNASEAHLAFADGDIPKNPVGKLYHWLINVSIISRWIIFIVPVLGILWIPGILGLTAYPRTVAWGVPLLWWSIWLSVVWGGWWATLAVAKLLPIVVGMTIGVVAVSSRRYIQWLGSLHRYVAFAGYSLSVWITWNPMITNQIKPDQVSQGSREILSTLGKLWFGIWICAAVLLFEKFSIQWIAGKFHERSYAERITDQKFAIHSLVTLYTHSSNIPGRNDTLRDGPSADPIKKTGRFFKKAYKGVRSVAATTTTALGNVASEMTGSSVLQPNSPASKVQTALASANKSRLLARRLFYSFVKTGSEYIYLEDVSRFFANASEAEHAFGVFDKDGNGDASRDEIEVALMEIHREQLSIEHSMSDLDSAVGRLDNIFMSLYVVVAVLIIAVAMQAQLATVITGAGTLILGLSWLIGGSLQEVLTSIIFLFIKHPFDVGDRITVSGNTYTVKEIRLLSSIFTDSHGTTVQAPNTVLNGQFIQNYRRSGLMSETFLFDVSFGTSFEDLEILRKKMLTFLENHSRDYLTVFDVTVLDFPDQGKLSLSADIKYKSNSQMASIKAKRRNRWICALKVALAETKIFGSGGDPNAGPSVARTTSVPWEKINAEDMAAQAADAALHQGQNQPVGGWHLTDPSMRMAEVDIFDEAEQVNMPNPVRGMPEAQPAGMRNRPNVLMPAGPGESIEMQQPARQ